MVFLRLLKFLSLITLIFYSIQGQKIFYHITQGKFVQFCTSDTDLILFKVINSNLNVN